MAIITASRMAYKPLKPLEGITWLEKAEATGKVTLEDIGDALEEFARLFKAGIASKAETLTLARAFPDNGEYTSAAQQLEDDPMVVGGPASVELIDREGHLITTNALKRAFEKFMANFRTRNAMVLHSDVQVGWALPAYISRGGQIFRSGVDEKGLFFICELRDDTKISDKVKDQINEGRLKSYSIAGSATKVQNMQKGLTPYMQVDEMELAEVTVCEKGVNQGANFELLKAEMPQTGQINKDQCEYRDATPEESMRGEDCGHCKFFNAEDKTCSVVSGDIQPGDWCKIFAPSKLMEPKKVVIVMRGTDKPDFKKSFDNWMEKTETKKDPLKAKESLATLQNFAGRESEHHRLLQEFGFPSEQPSESSRYVPVIEQETDDKGVPINLRPPWVVNEAGQDLGEKLDEDSHDYKKSDKAKNRAKAGSVQKMGDLFLEKDTGEGKDAERKALEDMKRREAQRDRQQAPGRKKAVLGRRRAQQQERKERDAKAAREAQSKQRQESDYLKNLRRQSGKDEQESADQKRDYLKTLRSQSGKDEKQRAGDAAKKQRGERQYLDRLRSQSGKDEKRAEKTRQDYLKNLRGQSAKDEQSASKSQARRQRSRAEGIDRARRGGMLSRLFGRGGQSSSQSADRPSPRREEMSSDEMDEFKRQNPIMRPGGIGGQDLSHDDHYKGFSDHHAQLNETGHATRREFYENLARLGMVKSGGSLFTVHPPKGADLEERIHASDFASEMKEHLPTVVHGDYQQHEAEIARDVINPYMHHLTNNITANNPAGDMGQVGRTGSMQSAYRSAGGGGQAQAQTPTPTPAGPTDEGGFNTTPPPTPYRPTTTTNKPYGPTSTSNKPPTTDPRHAANIDASVKSVKKSKPIDKFLKKALGATK